MSAYVSIVNYPAIFRLYDKSFFTRCIIGLKYSDENDVRNCYIDLLNSNTIDVDKLDYLIRDSFTTGFKSINIDYERLLNSVCVLKDEGRLLQGFTKSALSTLESVILAHDMERKWIQSHPVIMYDGCIVAYMIAVVQNDFEKNGIRLFSSEALSEKGIDVNKSRICLLSDSDICSNVKRYYGIDSRITEYFAREKRKKPLWKSESEYKYYFDPSGVSEKVLTLLEERMDSLEKAIVQKFDFPIIDQHVLDYFNGEIEAAKGLPKVVADTKKNELLKVVGLINLLKNFAIEKSFQFEYVVTQANQFKTGFNKDDLRNIRVRIHDDECCKLCEILKLFSTEIPREKYFYLFVAPESKPKINVGELSQRMVDYALKEFQRK
jgi:HD superfamily phosphohydrolase